MASVFQAEIGHELGHSVGETDCSYDVACHYDGFPPGYVGFIASGDGAYQIGPFGFVVFGEFGEFQICEAGVFVHLRAEHQNLAVAHDGVFGHARIAEVQQIFYGCGYGLVGIYD